ICDFFQKKKQRKRGEDDGRLKKCYELKMAVVPPDSIKACVPQHRIILLELYAADEHETNDNDDDNTNNSANKSKKNVARKSVIKRFTELFIKPYPNAIEEESLQTEMSQSKQKAGSKNSCPFSENATMKCLSLIDIVIYLLFIKRKGWDKGDSNKKKFQQMFFKIFFPFLFGIKNRAFLFLTGYETLTFFFFRSFVLMQMIW
ncbi:hypothetical protein RFI_22413, partial [Reticulomyxa filosa]